MSLKCSKCCPFVRLSEAICILGIIGSMLHGIGIVAETLYGHSYLFPCEDLHPQTNRIISIIIFTVHVVGALVNILLFYGACKNQRHCLIPWLIFEGFASASLLSLSLYYLILYPENGLSILLWYSMICVMLFLCIIYCIYIVQELLYKLWVTHLITTKTPKDLPPSVNIT